MLCEIRLKAVDAQITLILTQRGGDKKEQYTGIRAMTDCICTLSCGAAIGTFTFEELQVFQTNVCGELTLWRGLIR